MTCKTFALYLAALCACSTEPELGATEQAGQNLNGQNLNGQNLNGQNLNGQNLNGQNLNGPDNGTFTIWTSLEGASREGLNFDSVQLTETQLIGRRGSSIRSGSEMIGSILLARRGNGETVMMAVRGVVPPAAGTTAWKYFIEYRETDKTWYPVCEDASGPIGAIALNGIWDHRQGAPGGGGHVADATKFTFACDNVGSIGKCVRMGYESWRTSGTVQLTNHLAACVRLMRGDYCGDGVSHTQNGNRVNLYDALSIQDDTEDWVIESEWDQHGARCFYPLNRSRAGIPCYDARVELACGSPSNFSAGALLMNETPTAGLTP